MFATKHLNTENQSVGKHIVKEEGDILVNIGQEVDMSLIEIAYNVEVLPKVGHSTTKVELQTKVK